MTSPSLRALVAAVVLLGVSTLLAPSTARAHGIWGHIHVTGWAIENLPPSDLRDFFDHPEVMNAALFGAAYTDSGYWPQGGELAKKSRAYSEHTHWEPFIQDFVAWILEHDPPPWDDLESRKRVAFLMGCAAHGLQDEVFDSLFLYQVQEHDGGGQSEADPGTDGFLALDEHLRFVPEVWYPLETLLELYQVLDEDVTADIIEDSVDVMTFVYVNEAGEDIAQNLGVEHEDVIPWTRDYYMEPSIPGSLRAEIGPTIGYLQALWKRLHGEFTHEDLVVHTYPEPPRRLHGRDHLSPDAWVTLVTGLGIEVRTALPTALWTTEGGESVDFRLGGTRWGGLDTWGRLVRYFPDETLEPGAWFTVSLGEGADLMDGSTLSAPFELTFQAPCDEETAELCPEVQLPEPYVIDPPEPEPAPEAGPEPQPEPAPEASPDLGPEPQPEAPPEAMADAGPEPAPDAASADGAPDAGPFDTETAETGSAPDTASDDTSGPDGDDPAGDSGCGGAPGAAPWTLLAALIAGLAMRARLLSGPGGGVRGGRAGSARW